MNAFRAQHQAGSLVWDPALATQALAQAEVQVAQAPTGGFYKSGASVYVGGRVVGTNMHLSPYPSAQPVTDYAQAVSNWDQEGSTYCAAQPDKTGGLVFEDGGATLTPASHAFFEKTGHFTQAVWRGTTRVGCAHASSAAKGRYVVCNYLQAGNVRNTYDVNVKC